MPEIMHTLHRYIRLPMPTLIVIAIVVAVFVVAFASGFYTSRLMDEARVQEQAEARFGEFLTVGIDLGIVTVDTQKLDEIACIASESEWEDEDADEQEKGDEP